MIAAPLLIRSNWNTHKTNSGNGHKKSTKFSRWYSSIASIVSTQRGELTPMAHVEKGYKLMDFYDLTRQLTHERAYNVLFMPYRG